MVSSTLAQLEVWYDEPTTASERPKLLSKLALLELCGWLETEQDRIILKISESCLNDASWSRTELIEKTYGFDYKRHFRPMLAKLLGEHLTRKLERILESQFPGDIEQLRSLTGDLWAKRCSFAHEDMVTNVQKQQHFDAPSWTHGRYHILSGILSRLESEALKVAREL